MIVAIKISSTLKQHIDNSTEIDTHSGLWVLWLFAGSCLIVLLVGCAAFDRFKAEFLRLKMLASIDVDFNHTKDQEADDEVSDDEKTEELHYAVDKGANASKSENQESKMQLNARQNMEKMMEMVNEAMSASVNAAKREMTRMKEKIQKQKENVFDNMWVNDEDLAYEQNDHAVI